VEKTPSEVEREAAKAAQRAEARRTREIAELEERIKGLESRLAVLSATLEQAGSTQQVEQVRELGVEYEQVERELQACLAQWGEVAG
jgi:phage shock protein A